MAWLEKHRSGNYHVAFRFAGEKFKKSLGTANERTAQGRVSRLEENILLVESGRLTIPEGTDIPTFLLSDGKLNGQLQRPPIRFVGELFDTYTDQLTDGSIEESTRTTITIHVKHLKRILGKRTRIEVLDGVKLQEYVNRRNGEKGLRGKTVSPTTIKKEISTLGSVWTWAMGMKLVAHPLPTTKLRFAKTDEKPPFQTWAEIERQIERGGLSENEQAELWDCLFLTVPEVDEVLQFVKMQASRDFVYPMFVFAAHTGARRSEMLRSVIDDIDFDRNTVLIHEKKRVRGKRTTRRVPLSPFLVQVLKVWLSTHPGGRYTFCHRPEPFPSEGKRTTCRPLSPQDAANHLRATLDGSKWEVIRGWHVFRHSFCSNCAAAGIDQRIINAWVGHQTEEMVRRYRHLIPNQQQEAIRSVFGDSSEADRGRPTPPSASVGDSSEAAA